jgi:hypothetical protein
MSLMAFVLHHQALAHFAFYRTLLRSRMPKHFKNRLSIVCISPYPSFLIVPHHGHLARLARLHVLNARGIWLSYGHTTDLVEASCNRSDLPASFKGSNGDGLGDIAGVISKIDYIASLGVDAI